MTADEIRKSDSVAPLTNREMEEVRWLQEIAAQLAEMNQAAERIASALEGIERRK